MTKRFDATGIATEIITKRSDTTGITAETCHRAAADVLCRELADQEQTEIICIATTTNELFERILLDIRDLAEFGGVGCDINAWPARDTKGNRMAYAPLTRATAEELARRLTERGFTCDVMRGSFGRAKRPSTTSFVSEYNLRISW